MRKVTESASSIIISRRIKWNMDSKHSICNKFTKFTCTHVYFQYISDQDICDYDNVIKYLLHIKTFFSRGNCKHCMLKLIQIISIYFNISSIWLSKVKKIFFIWWGLEVHVSSGTFRSLSERNLLFSIWLRPWFEVWGRDCLVIGSDM